MTVSRRGKRTGAGSRRRDKRAEARAKETQRAQHEAEAGKLTLAAYRRRRLLGWSLVGLGVVVGVQHWLSHLGLFSVISPGVDDVVVGYPLAGLLGIAGAIVLSKS